MPASISDVAARAGVSVATVSRALRGLPNVAPSTRDRVLLAAEDLDYVVDPNASRLAMGETRAIGIVLPLVDQWFFAQCLAGAEAVLAEVGYDVMLYSISGSGGRERFIEDLPFRKRVDGIIIIDVLLTEEELDTLAATEVPILTVGLRTDRFPSVTIDNESAGMTATRHLANLGHEEIGLIGGAIDDPLQTAAPLDRRTGYQRVLEEQGLKVRSELEAAGNFSLEGGAEAAAQLLSTERPPTAVFALSDEMAIGALKTVSDSGLRVPDDISIIGFDDHEIAEYVGLTTVSQPVVEQGETAANMMLEQVRAKHEAQERVVMPTKLTVRNTTGPWRGRAQGRPPR